METGSACANKRDDDGDGLTDCADPDCADSGACESNLDACSNGLDDDNNQRVDCEEKTCVQLGFCEPRDAPCDWETQTGCVRGLSCVPRERSGGTSCERAGEGGLSDLCVGHEDCKAPALCIGGICTPHCSSQADCPRGAGCSGGSASVCLPGCTPVTGTQECPVGACVPLNALGAPYMYNDMKIVGTCTRGASHSGMVPEGGECADPAFTPPSTPTVAERQQMCASTLVCVPNGNEGRGVCRATCAFGEDGSIRVPCSASIRKCVEAFRGDARSTTLTGYVPGLCVPP